MAVAGGDWVPDVGEGGGGGPGAGGGGRGALLADGRRGSAGAAAGTSARGLSGFFPGPRGPGGERHGGGAGGTGGRSESRRAVPSGTANRPRTPERPDEPAADLRETASRRGGNGRHAGGVGAGPVGGRREEVGTGTEVRVGVGGGGVDAGGVGLGVVGGAALRPGGAAAEHAGRGGRRELRAVDRLGVSGAGRPRLDRTELPGVADGESVGRGLGAGAGPSGDEGAAVGNRGGLHPGGGGDGAVRGERAFRVDAERLPATGDGGRVPRETSAAGGETGDAGRGKGKGAGTRCVAVAARGRGASGPAGGVPAAGGGGGGGHAGLDDALPAGRRRGGVRARAD